MRILEKYCDICGKELERINTDEKITKYDMYTGKPTIYSSFGLICPSWMPAYEYGNDIEGPNHFRSGYIEEI
jgi:hypothetical protein